MIEARVVADSLNESGADRLTTMIVTYPRFILAELNTTRVFSRNSASSRAIPVSKQVERVRHDPALPVEWGRNQRGMQAGELLGEEIAGWARAEWLRAAASAADRAAALDDLGVHKQVANRLIEPFAWMTTLVSATEWQNFFALRAHRDAQPEFRELAFQMLDAYMTSVPVQLARGGWHIPFGDSMPDGIGEEVRIKVAVARCARLSYLTHNGVRDVAADVAMHDRLLASSHFSPFEHVARAGVPGVFTGNFRGFRQYRKMLAGENQTVDLNALWESWKAGARRDH